MNIGGVLLGLLNIAIVVVLLLIVGVIAQWLLGSIAGLNIPAQLVQLYLALVALLALYMIVALVFGLPSVTIFR